MARRPVWLAGIAADALGFVAQAIALTIGRLAVVQPLLVSSVVFALPLGVKLTGQKVHRIDVARGARRHRRARRLPPRRRPVRRPRRRAVRRVADRGRGVRRGQRACSCSPPAGRAPRAEAALLGTSCGVLFGLSAALTKTVGDQVADAPLEVFVHWHLYALIVVGYLSLTISQLSLQTGVLAPAIATAMAFDPITSVVLGTTIMQESLHTSTAGSVAACAALVAALGGLAVLARREEGATQTKPAGGTQVAGEGGGAFSATLRHPRPASADPRRRRRSPGRSASQTASRIQVSPGGARSAHGGEDRRAAR